MTHQCAIEIQFMCRKLELPPLYEDVAFALVQRALKDEEELLWGRSLDQLIVCSIYGTCKIKKNPLKLSHIIGSYGDVFELSSREIEDLG